MPDDTDPNTCPPSTTWEWKTVRIRKRPQGRKQQRAKRTSFSELGPYPPREALMVKVRYRGGPECWWEITARGKTVRRPGVLALHDVLRDIYRMD